MEGRCPKRKLIHKDTELEFNKIIIPSKMRSVYWKYFGFPADAQNNIVAHDTIVCTLCSKAIAYNKNTTNLRTHLTAKHNHVIPELNAENEMKPAKKTKIPTRAVTKIEPMEKKRPRRKIEVVMNSSNEPIPTEIEIVDHQEKIGSEVYNYQEYSTIEETPYEVEEVNIGSINTASRSSINLTEQIQEMLITDLLPTGIVEGSGFLNFMYSVLHSTSVPRAKEVEANVINVYDHKFKCMHNNKKNHSEIKSFSLGFEVWTNVESRTFVSIYFNNISRDFGIALEHVLYCTVELFKYTDFDEVFAGINLKNCFAAIVNMHNTILDNFLVNNGIPTIPCFEFVVHRCLKAVFSLHSVSTIFTEISDLLEKHTDILPEIENLPQINCSFPWTKYNLLKFFYDNVLGTEEPNDLLVRAKELMQCLDPLKVALDTVSEETNALSSLVKPLTRRLLQQHFCTNASDSNLTIEIKDAIHRELSKSILSNNLLTISAFLDPRFHKFLEPSEIRFIKQNLEGKLNELDDAKVDPGLRRVNIRSGTGSNFSRRSGLKMFFETSEPEPEVPLNRNVSIELDINKYRMEALADLEYDPLIWWNKYGYAYEALKKISEVYNCIPACVNNVYKRSIENQIEFSNRRFMLKGKLINQMLFLHYNKKI